MGKTETAHMIDAAINAHPGVQRLIDERVLIRSGFFIRQRKVIVYVAFLVLYI